MSERARIARVFAPLTLAEPGSFQLQDDAAALDVPPGKKLVITTDSVIAGTHIVAQASAAQMAVKLMRRNLSDLAAMGATPWRYTLNAHTTPGLPDSWFAEFAQALAAEQAQFGLVLVGGDSTSGHGPIHMSMTCFGLADRLLRQQGAQPGDRVYVSGTIGDAALGLRLGLQERTLAARYFAPPPRLALGQQLHGIATSCIDISDGLVADAEQLAQGSRVQLVLTSTRVPLSATARAHQGLADFWQTVCAGDDYELLFTAPPSADAAIAHLAHTLGVPLTPIGEVEARSGKAGAVLLNADGSIIPNLGGYEHG